MFPKIKNNTNNTLFNLDACLAKTYKTLEGEKRGGRHVLNHCHIVGEVGKELLNRIPDSLKADLFPKGSELIAACHDIGKVSPTFQEKIYRGTEGYKKKFQARIRKGESRHRKTMGRPCGS